MPKPGRPRSLDEIKQREVLALISVGCGLETAAHYVGCSSRTIHRETRRNKEFWDRFRKAELASTLSPLQTVQNAAHSNWRAATWLLERKLPQHFAPTHCSMIDPDDLGQIFDRFMDEISRCIPDEQTRDRILRRIENATVTAVHEATTTRKNPKTCSHKSSPRKLPFQAPHSPLPIPDSDLPPNSPPTSGVLIKNLISASILSRLNDCRQLRLTCAAPHDNPVHRNCSSFIRIDWHLPERVRAKQHEHPAIANSLVWPTSASGWQLAQTGAQGMSGGFDRRRRQAISLPRG